MATDLDRLKTAAQQIRELRRLEGHSDSVWSVAFSPDGRVLASGSDDRTIRLWDPETGRELRRLEGHSGKVFSVAFSPDGRVLASGSNDKTIRLWDPETGRELRRLEGHRYYVNSVAFSPDGRVLASGSDDNTIRLWDPETGRELQRLEGHHGEVNRVAFSPDGRVLASGSDDKTVQLWDPQTGRELRRLEGHSHWVVSVAFSPDGRVLASGSYDETIRLWDPQTGRVLRRLEGHSDYVWSVAFSPDGRVLISASGDNTDRFWDLESGQQLTSLSRQDGHVNGLAFAPNGMLLASGDNGRTIRLWDISILNVSPKVKPEEEVTEAPTLSPELAGLLQVHLATLPFVHRVASAPERPASWLKHAASLGMSAPLFLVNDLGMLLSQSRTHLNLSRPAHLPQDVITAFYLHFLKRLADHPLLKQISTWQLKDECIGVVIARLLSGCSFAKDYALPQASEAVLFRQELVNRLKSANPAQIWRETKAADRPVFKTLAPGKVLTQIEANLQKLSLDELRLLHEYGPRFAGSPDPRDLLDLFNLLGLPASIKLALSQVLKLVPRISHKVSGEHAQTYAMGGYAGLTHKGSLDSLLPSELAYPAEMFLHRVLNNEALYYGRESEQEKRKELAYIITQMGTEMQGDVEVLARSLSLALAKTLKRRGYEVRHSFVGSTWTEPGDLERPAELHKLLYYRDAGWLHSRQMLEAVLTRLRTWSEHYRRMYVYWVVGEFWDADDYEENSALYQGLRQKAEQQAWFIRLGEDQVLSGATVPVTAKRFHRYQILATSCLWADQKGANGALAGRTHEAH